MREFLRGIPMNMAVTRCRASSSRLGGIDAIAVHGPNARPIPGIEACLEPDNGRAGTPPPATNVAKRTQLPGPHPTYRSGSRALRPTTAVGNPKAGVGSRGARGVTRPARWRCGSWSEPGHFPARHGRNQRSAAFTPLQLLHPRCGLLAPLTLPLRPPKRRQRRAPKSSQTPKISGDTDTLAS
jgi:hypothetical protein